MTERTTWRERRFRKIIASLDGKILNADDLTGGRAPGGLFCLWGGQIGKLLDDNWRPTRAGIRFRRLIHPIFPLLGEKFLSNPQVIKNRNRLMDAASTAPDNGITLPDEPVIFCVNHHFKDVFWTLSAPSHVMRTFCLAAFQRFSTPLTASAYG